MGQLWAGIVRVSFMGDRRAGADDFHADRDQIATVNRYAAQHNARVEFLDPELSVSGGKPINERPSLRAAIEGVEAGIYDGIVVAYLSRLTRSRSGLEIWERVEKAGGHVHCAAENLDTSTPNGRFIRDIHLANAVREREEHVDRFEMRREHATAAGIWQRRQVPRGYVRDPDTRHLVIDPEGAAQVRQAFAMMAARETVVSIADMLGMTPQGTRCLLRNRVYLGELRVGQHVNPDAHPAIITIDAFERAQVKGARPPRSQHAGPAMLAGIVRCQACGHVMTRGNSGGRPVYTCPGRRSGGRCQHPAAVTTLLLDEHVQRIVLADLERIAVTATSLGSGLDEARARLGDAERELGAYLAAVSAADVGVEAFAAGAKQRRESVDAARTDMRARLAAVPDVPAVGTAAEMWEGMDAHARNALLRALLEVVIVKRAGGRGSRTPLGERVRVVAHGTGLLPDVAGPPEAGRGLAALPWPDLGDEGVLREPAAE